MKNICLILLIYFLFFHYDVKAQSKGIEVLIKTHPVADAFGFLNLGTEIGKLDGNLRFTFTAYRQSSFPVGLRQALINYEGEDGDVYKVRGVTYRAGLKYFIQKDFYVEPQIRYGSTKGDYNAGVLGSSDERYAITSQTKQIGLLLGHQSWVRRKNRAILDIYIGLGYCSTTVEGTKSVSKDPQSLGQPLSQQFSGLTGYLGVVVGLFVYKTKLKT